MSWTPIAHGTLELRLVEAGASSPTQAIQRCTGRGNMKPLEPGIYRYSKGIEVDGSNLTLRATFHIT